jgi:hypothetical protein
MNTLPALPEADKRGLAPPDLFPHKLSAKTPVLSDGVEVYNQT